MAVRNNKLSLEEVGGFLVDINRPTAGTNVVVRGGTLILNDQIKNYPDTVVNFTLSGMSGTSYYKVLVYIDTVSGDILSTNAIGPGQTTFALAKSGISIPIEPNQIPLAYVIVQCSGTGGSSIYDIASPDQIVDLRSTVNVARNIEQLYTTEASPENLVVVANADGSLTATSTLDGLTRVEVVGTADANFSDSPPSDSEASITTEGGVSVDQKLHVGGDVRIQSTSSAADNTGSSGALQVKGGVSVGKGDGPTTSGELADFQATSAPADIKVLGDGLFGGNVKSKEAFLEEGLITIGDGATTFGHYNASAGDITAAFASAVARTLTTNSKIRVKSGTYTASGDLTISSGISIEGEGVGTVITFSNATHSMVLNGDGIEVSGLTLTSGVAGVTLLTGSGVSRCVVEKVRFTEVSLSPSTDVSSGLSLNNILTNCISTTTTTNLP